MKVIFIISSLLRIFYKSWRENFLETFLEFDFPIFSRAWFSLVYLLRKVVVSFQSAVIDFCWPAFNNKFILCILALGQQNVPPGLDEVRLTLLICNGHSNLKEIEVWILWLDVKNNQIGIVHASWSKLKCKIEKTSD